MYCASRCVRPSDCVLLSRSLPARSTRCSLETVRRSSFVLDVDNSRHSTWTVKMAWLLLLLLLSWCSAIDRLVIPSNRSASASSSSATTGRLSPRTYTPLTDRALFFSAAFGLSVMVSSHTLRSFGSFEGSSKS